MPWKWRVVLLMALVLVVVLMPLVLLSQVLFVSVLLSMKESGLLSLKTQE